MKEFNDEDLISKVKEECCNDSFGELVHRHSNLYYKICQKYLPALRQMGVPSEDIFNDKEYVFFKSLNSFNPQKNTKYSTWLGNYARYNCLNYINDYKRHNFYEENDIESISEMTAPELTPEDGSGVDYIFSILSKLKDRRIIKVYKMRYEGTGEKKATWSEIATKMSISTQTAINLHSRGKKFLKIKLKSKDFQDIV